MLSAAQPTCLLIADVSGYTGYLADVELDHAQDILADLIGAVVSALRPAFRLAKLEGDAAFTSMTAERLDFIEQRHQRVIVSIAFGSPSIVGVDTPASARLTIEP